MLLELWCPRAGVGGQWGSDQQGLSDSEASMAELRSSDCEQTWLLPGRELGKKDNVSLDPGLKWGP